MFKIKQEKSHSLNENYSEFKINKQMEKRHDWKTHETKGA